MQNKINKVLFLAFSGALLLAPQFAFAQQSSSTNYAVDEIFMGPGGSSDVSSPNYSARATVGDTALPQNSEGNADSNNNQSYGGNTTTDVPELELTLNQQSIDMGVLSPSAASTGTATFSVRTYLASGYVVYSIGNPPTATSGRSLAALTNGGTSSPGTEQFGINLVGNSNPVVGSNPTQTPDNTFSFGTVANNYAIANTFRYNSGEAVAQSNSSSGVTTYTISYLVNINPTTTPAGQYIFKHSIVVTSTY